MRSRRYYERQIDKLLTVIADQNDRIMYLAGHAWQGPPLVQVERPTQPEPTFAAPEQLPDDYWAEQ